MSMVGVVAVVLVSSLDTRTAFDVINFVVAADGRGNVVTDASA